MGAHRVRLSPAAEGAVKALHPEIRRVIRNALSALSVNPEIGLPLTGELQGLYRYRVRRYRIVYEVVGTTRAIRVLAIGHRRDVYEILIEKRR